MLKSRPLGSTFLSYLVNLTRWDNIVPISIKVVDNMHYNNVLLKKS